MSVNNLNSRLIENIDYTLRDEIIFDIMDVMKCPITLETHDDMVIFNHQFYDRLSFNNYRQTEVSRNQRSLSSGYPDVIANNYFKDPRTGVNFNPTFALRTLLQSRPTRDDIRTTLKTRIENVTDDNVDLFLPPDEDAIIHNFITLIRQLAHVRARNRAMYTNHIETVANTAAQSTPRRPPNRPHSYSLPNPRSLRADNQSEANAVLQRANREIDLDSISSDSTSQQDPRSDHISIPDDDSFAVDKNLGAVDIGTDLDGEAENTTETNPSNAPGEDTSRNNLPSTSIM